MVAVMIFIATFVVTTFVKSAGRAGGFNFSWSWRASSRSPVGFRCGLRKTSGWKNWKWTNLPAPKANRHCLMRKNRKFFRQDARVSSSRNFLCRASAFYCSWLEAGGAWFLWRWLDKTNVVIAPETRTAGARALRDFALVLFLIGRFSVTIARLENHRLLRPSASFLLAGRVYLCFCCAWHRGSRSQNIQGGFLGGARVVRAARLDGGGNAHHAAAGNLSSARQGQDRAPAL